MQGICYLKNEVSMLARLTLIKSGGEMGSMNPGNRICCAISSQEVPFRFTEKAKRWRILAAAGRPVLIPAGRRSSRSSWEIRWNHVLPLPSQAEAFLFGSFTSIVDSIKYPLLLTSFRFPFSCSRTQHLNSKQYQHLNLKGPFVLTLFLLN